MLSFSKDIEHPLPDRSLRSASEEGLDRQTGSHFRVLSQMACGSWLLLPRTGKGLVSESSWSGVQVSTVLWTMDALVMRVLYLHCSRLDPVCFAYLLLCFLPLACVMP